MNLPNRSKEHQIDSRAITQIKSVLTTDWLCREQNERDYGIDLCFERFDGENPTGDVLYAQVKGTEKEFTEDNIKLSFPTKTINYALLFNIPFFVFYTSVTSKITKFVWLQKYVELYLEPNKYNWKNQEDITIYFPIRNTLEQNIEKIVDIVKRDREIKIALKYITHYERLNNYYNEIKKGKYFSASICKQQIYEIIKLKVINQPIYYKLSSTEDVILLFPIFEKIESTNNITEDEINFIDKIMKFPLGLIKLQFLNMDAFNDMLPLFLDEDNPPY